MINVCLQKENKTVYVASHSRLINSLITVFPHLRNSRAENVTPTLKKFFFLHLWLELPFKHHQTSHKASISIVTLDDTSREQTPSKIRTNRKPCSHELQITNIKLSVISFRFSVIFSKGIIFAAWWLIGAPVLMTYVGHCDLVLPVWKGSSELLTSESSSCLRQADHSLARLFSRRTVRSHER